MLDFPHSFFLGVNKLIEGMGVYRRWAIEEKAGRMIWLSMVSVFGTM